MRRHLSPLIVLWVLTFALYMAALALNQQPAAAPATWVDDAVGKIQADRTALDLRAAKLCREIHGEAGYTWAEDGTLVCLPRKGGRS